MILSIPGGTLDTATQTATVDGVRRPWTEQEAAWAAPFVEAEARAAERGLIRAQLADGIGQLDAAIDMAGQHIADATARRAAALAARTQLAAVAAQVAASTPAATLAYLTAIRDRVADLYMRQAQAAQAVAASAQDDIDAGAGVRLAYRALRAVARLLSGLIER